MDPESFAKWLDEAGCIKDCVTPHNKPQYVSSKVFAELEAKYKKDIKKQIDKSRVLELETEYKKRKAEYEKIIATKRTLIEQTEIQRDEKAVEMKADNAMRTNKLRMQIKGFRDEIQGFRNKITEFYDKCRKADNNIDKLNNRISNIDNEKNPFDHEIYEIKCEIWKVEADCKKLYAEFQSKYDELKHETMAKYPQDHYLVY
jgi:chromosome segregation ATPase